MGQVDDKRLRALFGGKKKLIICQMTVVTPQKLTLEYKTSLRGSLSKDRILHTPHALQIYKFSLESVDACEEEPMYNNVGTAVIPPRAPRLHAMVPQPASSST